MITKKMAEQGVKLSKKQKELIATNLAENQNANLKFQNWKFWDRRHINIEITKEDVAEIENKSSDITARSTEIIFSMIEKVSDIQLSKLKQRYKKISRKELGVKKSFEKHVASLWKEPIDLLSMTLGLSRDLGEIINNRLRENNTVDKKYSMEIITRLHARGCQVMSEIITLLLSGFADGAMARWRTLHEIAVTTYFLTKYGEPAAERYHFHQIVETCKAARQFEKFRVRLGFEPIPQDELLKMEEDYKKVVGQYGQDYSHQYGWASTFLNNSNPKFSDIEQAANVDYIRPYYKMACDNVHATSTGAFFRLGLMPEFQLLLSGPSDFGLADPGRNSALTLAQINSNLVLLDSSFESLVALKMLDSLSKDAGDLFITVQAEIEKAVV
ncbi:MAG: DUF5677 domain-containing protein [bacterium]